MGNKEVVNYNLIVAVREGNLEEARELINFYGLSYSPAWSEGYVLLCSALKDKHAAVKLLLTRGSKVNSKNPKPTDTPLHFAVLNGYIEIVEMILIRGANVNAKNEYGKTSLHIAAEKGCSQIVGHLLKYRAYINCVCKLQRGYTPLHYAVERGRTEVTSLLLSRGASVDAKDEDGMTPLHIAASNGYIPIAEDLLNHGACIHSSTLTEGYTPLHFASGRDNGEAAELFLNKGANINTRTKDNSTPLHIATETRCNTVVNVLLQHGAKVDDQDENGKTVLRLAAEKGNSTIVESVLKYCPDINNQSNRSSLKIAVYGYGEASKKIGEALLEYGFIVDPEDANDPELLHAAVEKGYLKIVEDLLKHGADVNTLHNSSYREGFTLLHCAAKNKQEEVAKLLISYKADVNARDKTGKTPVFYAIENADSKITKLLLINKADIKGNPELLNIAVKKTCIEIVEALLQHGADIKASDKFGRTALHFIVLSENDINIKGEIAKLLLSKGANVDAQTKNGTTILYAAVQKGYAKVVEALLEYNANIDSVVNIERKDEITPLHLAIREGHEEVVKILLERGAKVDSKIKNDKTPLHFAAEKGYQKIIETILKFGADIDSRDAYGKTALHIASQRGHDNAVATLLEYGSDINVTTEDNDTALGYALDGLRSFYNQPRYDDSDDEHWCHNPRDSICGHDLTVEALQSHIIKMRIADLYVSPALLQSMYDSYEPRNFNNECEEEIASMKSEKINNFTISFYDILTNDTSSLAIYMRNENIVRVLLSDDYKTKFPIYARMIENRIRKGIERKELLEGNKIFHILSNNLPELPYDCVEKIISYLSNKDLRKLIDACKSVGISDTDTDINDTETTSNIS